MFDRFQICIFFSGLMAGFFLAIIRFVLDDSVPPPSLQEVVIEPERVSAAKWSGLKFREADPQLFSFSQDRSFHLERLESQTLFVHVRLTCAIFVTRPNNTYVVAETWAKKCNSVYYYSDKEVPYLETQLITSSSSWHFLCKVIRNLWHHDWVIFSKDDILVIPENLRYLLAHANPSDSYYLGHNSIFWGQLYNTAKTAYVLSRGAMRAIARKFNSSASCAQGGNYRNNEDFILGQHLAKMGIFAADSRDDKGRQRFHLFKPDQLLVPGNINLLKKYFSRSYYPLVLGPDCCSPTSVSFYGSQKDLMYLYCYLLYSVRLFTTPGSLGNNLTKLSARSNKVWIDSVKEIMGDDFDLTLMTDKRYYDMWTLIEEPQEFSKKLRKEMMKT